MGFPLNGQSENFSSKCGFPPIKKKKNPKHGWGVLIVVN